MWDTASGWEPAFRHRAPLVTLIRQARPADPVRFATSDYSSNDGFLVIDGPPWATPAPTLHGRAGLTPGGAGVVVYKGNGALEVLYGNASTTAAGGAFRLPNDDRAEDGSIGEVLVHPGGEWVAASAEHRRSLRLWSMLSGRLEASRVVEEGSLRMAFSPDGSTLAVTTDSGTLLYGLRPSRVTSSAAVGPIPLLDADVSADGRTIMASSTHKYSLVRWQTTRPGLPIKTADAPMPVEAIASSTDSRWTIFTMKIFMAAQHVTLSQHSRSFDMSGFETTRELRVGPDDRAWAIGAYGLRTFKLAEWLGPEKVKPAVDEFPVTAEVNLTCVYPCRGEAWVGRDDGQVCRHAAIGGPPTATHRMFPGAVAALARSGDGRFVLAGAKTGAVRVIDAATGQVRVDIPRAHEDEVVAVAFLPGGGFVTGSRDRTVKLWDAAGNRVLTLPQTRPVRRVFVSADGTTLSVLAEGERGLRQWHLDRLRAELAALGLDAGLPQ